MLIATRPEARRRLPHGYRSHKDRRASRRAGPVRPASLLDTTRGTADDLDMVEHGGGGSAPAAGVPPVTADRGLTRCAGSPGCSTPGGRPAPRGSPAAGGGHGRRAGPPGPGRRAGSGCDPDRGLAFGHRRLAVVELGPKGTSPCCRPTAGGCSTTTARSTTTPRCAGGWPPRAWPSAVARTPRCWWRRCRRGASGRRSRPARGCSPWPCGTGTVAELHLVRDRFGEKPLYYGWVGGRLAFASELKSLCLLPEFRAEIDRDAVALYLRHNCVPAPHTIYGAWPSCSPGSWSPCRGDVPARAHPSPTRAYWSAARGGRRRLAGDRWPERREAMADRLEAALSDSVAARMVADVPVGRLPLRRGRLERGRGPHAAAQCQAGAHLHGRVRRPCLRRVGRGRRGRRPPRHRPHPAATCTDARRHRGHPRAARHLGRALRRHLGRSPCTWSAGWPGRR